MRAGRCPACGVGEVCGQEAPVKLLDLEESQYFWSVQTLVEQLVERRVVGPSVGISSRLFDDDSIAYGVSDGDRSGIWRTRVTPPG